MPRKSLGQHFLTDQRVVAHILRAAGLEAGDAVLEIGPGRGVLTRRLVTEAEVVVAVELDRELCAALPGRLGWPSNLACVEADARTIDAGRLVFPRTRYKVVANLPYYAANPIIRNLLESNPKPKSMVVMVQKEVADSMTAAPGRMGLLSVATQVYARSRIVCTVPPSGFRPPPNVTSAVVQLDVRETAAVADGDTDGFFEVVRAGFSAPRKQLRNSLSHGLDVPAAAASEVLDAADIDGQRRAQTLALDEWSNLYKEWQRVKDQWK